MAGLSGTLSIALSALSVSQQELATTSNNVANANTPGFSRQRPVTTAGEPVVFGTFTFGTGVVLQKIESLRDPILEIQLNQETQQQSKLNTSLTQLQQLQTQFASASSGIGADISNLFNSLQQLSPDPSNLNLRESVLTAANTLATDFNSTANNLQTQRSNLDLNVEQAVGQVNTLTAQIAGVDEQISNLQNAHLDSSSLVDTQTTLIRQLSGLVDVSVIPTDQGITLALSNGTTLVSGSHSYALSTQLGKDNVQHVMAGTEDITSSLTGGSLAGMIQVRDQEIPSIGSSLDQLAAGLATNLNTANNAGYDLYNTHPADDLFVSPPLGGVGAAATLMLEGGNLGQVLQPTAAMIVFGGTLGAILIQYPLPVALSAFRRLAKVFVEPAHDAQSTIELLVKYANQARREGIISLDKELATIDEPFLRRALMLAVDGTEPQELRKIMELELDNKEEQEEKIPQLFESAGGFSPTIGIIGAVLGLIQVMQHLDKIDEVGKGIAVAFVATLYGVGAANLILLPVAGKLKIRIRDEQIIREMTIEGVVSLLEGMNPRMLEEKLLGFLTHAREPAAVPEVSNV